MDDNTAVLAFMFAAQAQSATKKPISKITVIHKTGMELTVEEEKRRKKIKSLQRKNKRRKRND